MLETISLALDAGLLVLIWMVQLIVYPSFVYYEKENLLVWHKKYTGLIALIVMPLMLGQLGFATYAVFDKFQWILALKFILIVLVWLSTFVYFAPTHGRISSGNFSNTTLHQIVQFNWFRTILWTLVALLSFLP
jgi:hypothetical protein